MSQIRFYSFYFFYVLALIYLAITLPIGPNEASLFYKSDSIVYQLMHLSNGCFSNGLDFRLPFLFFGVMNISLFLMMSKIYFKKIEESYLATTIFALLPGIITSSIIVNIAVIVVTLVLLFLIFYEKKNIYMQLVIMLLLLLVHNASIIFFIALLIFSGLKKKWNLFLISSLFALLFILHFNGLDISGRPSGKFMELLGLYLALFSPFVFIYFFYALYRIWQREQKDILWYISFTAFILSIILSLRQQVIMTDFTPYVIVAVVLMILIYQKTLQVRLPQFQKVYAIGFKLVIGSLVFTALVILFHQLFFLFIEDKSKHFTYDFYEPYWKMKELKHLGQNCYTVESSKKQFQLKYYGIEKCEEKIVPKIHK